MKYTLQDLQEEKVYIEITCDEDFNKLLPYTNIISLGTNIKHPYPYQVCFYEEHAGWCTSYYIDYNYQKIEINDLFFDLDDLEDGEYYIELKNKQEIEDWKEIIAEKLPTLYSDILYNERCFFSFYDQSGVFDDDEADYIKDGYKKVELEFINLFSKENIKTKILTFTIDGESTYNLEIKWEDWELLKQGNKLKLL